MKTTVASLLASLLCAFLSTQVYAQGTSISAGENASLPFVPELQGEVVLGAGVQSRLLLGSEPFYAPGTHFELVLGYRHYLDDVGAVATGPYAYGTLLHEEHEVSARYGGGDPFQYQGFGGGWNFQLRGLSPQFVFGYVALFAEGGAVLHNAPESPDPMLPPEGTGVRMAVGVDSGLGLLGHLDPYVYAEGGVRFALERVSFGSVSILSLQFAWQARFDFALR